MGTRTFDRVTVTTPDLDEPGLYLSNVDTLDSPRGMVQDFTYGDKEVRSLDLADTRLVTGRIARISSKRVRFEELNLHGVEISRCDLGSAHWSDSKLRRVVFRDSKLMGAALHVLVLDDVLFENCKFDYSAFEKIRAVGPVVFSNCVLNEATFTWCDLSNVVFAECELGLTEFGTGRYQNTSLRGTSLSAIRGVANLSGIRIDHGQQAELAEALVGDLGVTFGDG
ncbi:pentapeptide repeat-containing protein [Streptomyces sp. NPDC003077]|uniref:pentapeptide repeat-containing protein n=1 Tax=Streptomyces sp. NPDC003077 TaxID=3154443 RepID=UPI0033B5BE9B